VDDNARRGDLNPVRTVYISFERPSVITDDPFLQLGKRKSVDIRKRARRDGRQPARVTWSPSRHLDFPNSPGSGTDHRR